MYKINSYDFFRQNPRLLKISVFRARQLTFYSACSKAGNNLSLRKEIKNNRRHCGKDYKSCYQSQIHSVLTLKLHRTKRKGSK